MLVGYLMPNRFEITMSKRLRCRAVTCGKDLPSKDDLPTAEKGGLLFLPVAPPGAPRHALFFLSAEYIKLQDGNMWESSIAQASEFFCSLRFPEGPYA
jgi:hypothetical protein